MTEKEILKRIYVSVTTYYSQWEKQIKEIKKLKIKEISLFLTCATITQRRKIYQALEKTSVKKIPHVHIRHDMTEEELDYLVKKFKSKVFTIHYQYINNFKNSKYKKQIFVEVNYHKSQIKNLKNLSKVGGVCIDLAHLREFEIRKSKHFETSKQAIKLYKLGCNHLSAVISSCKSWHDAKNFEELKYVENIPKKYFSKYICIELVNSISQQLKYKKQIAKLLVKAWQKNQHGAKNKY